MRRRPFIVVPFVPGPNNSGPAVEQSALYEAAAALSPGQYADFAAGVLTTPIQAEWEWQSHGVWDPVHKRVYVATKPVGDTAWQCYGYGALSEAWFNTNTGGFNNPGHVYGNFAIDEASGDLFLARGGMDGNGTDAFKRLRRYVYAEADWNQTTPAAQDITAAGLDSHSNGLACHPTGCGAGKPLVALFQQSRICLVNVVDDTRQDISLTTGDYGNIYGTGQYWPATGWIIGGGSDGKPLAKLTMSPPGWPTLSTFATPPIRCEGNSDGGAGGFGSLHVDPTDASKLILVERRGTRRWWTFDSSGTYTQRDPAFGAHPFDINAITVVSIPEIGVLWALGRNDTGPVYHSRLWKPNV